MATCPTERRAIEHGLRDGEILGVVSTNALELGVDIGRLDVSILAGYPGSVAGTWQQFGRAGRRQGTSVAILVASGAPVDQYVIHHPEFLLEGTPEEARLDPDNLHVLLAHLRAATFELPFEPGEVFGPGPADDLLAFLAEERHVRQAGDGRWYWSSENFPASEISLRTAAPENVVIIDTTRTGRGSSARSTCSAPRSSSTSGRSTSTSRSSTTSTGSSGTSARRTSTRSTSTTTPTRTGR